MRGTGTNHTIYRPTSASGKLVLTVSLVPLQVYQNVSIMLEVLLFKNQQNVCSFLQTYAKNFANTIHSSLLTLQFESQNIISLGH